MIKAATIFCGLGLFVICFCTLAMADCQDHGNTEVLSVLGQTKILNTDDYMTTALAAGEYLLGSIDFKGQMFYVPANSSADNHPLYRIYYSYPDHMDSLSLEEGAHTCGGSFCTLAYPFNTGLIGTCKIDRWYNPNLHDHATSFCDNSSLYSDPLPSGYSKEVPLGYGYPRYGKQRTVLETMSNQKNTLTLGINLAAGGVVSELVWNGMQFIDTYDYGREVQTALFFDELGCNNPTEGGDKYSTPEYDDGTLHGSPLISYSINCTTLETSVYPLQWDPGQWGGGPHYPVRWTGMIRKTVTLDFNGWSDVIQWVTNVYSPSNYGFLKAEIPAVYLNSEFTQFYTYDATTATRANVNAHCQPCYYMEPASFPAGGVIIATDDNQYALGAYRNNPGNNCFSLCNLISSSSTAKLSVNEIQRQNGLSAGVHYWVTYLIVGTLDTVTNRMHQLYEQKW
jgi:hypothetical protein